VLERLSASFPSAGIFRERDLSRQSSCSALATLRKDVGTHRQYWFGLLRLFLKSCSAAQMTLPSHPKQLALRALTVLALPSLTALLIFQRMGHELTFSWSYRRKLKGGRRVWPSWTTNASLLPPSTSLSRVDSGVSAHCWRVRYLPSSVVVTACFHRLQSPSH